MKIKLSKGQWEGIGKKAGWTKTSQSGLGASQKLTDMIQIINKTKDDFRNISSGLPKEKWALIEKDCDVVWQYLDNAAGRISTIINKSR